MASTSLIPQLRYSRDVLVGIPHLSVNEAVIWNRFLIQDESKRYMAFDYDIKVGEFAKAAILNPTPQNMLTLGTFAKRIDAVGFLSHSIVDIFEIKPERLANAVGQLLLYKKLFEDTFPLLSIHSLIAVLDKADDELVSFAHSYDITVLIV